MSQVSSYAFTHRQRFAANSVSRISLGRCFHFPSSLLVGLSTLRKSSEALICKHSMYPHIIEASWEGILRGSRVMKFKENSTWFKMKGSLEIVIVQSVHFTDIAQNVK